MKFGPLQKAYFNADEGAYSIVTGRERDDGQITVTEAEGEANIVLSAIPRANIPRGAAAGKRQSLDVIHRDGQELSGSLTINFPKADRDELRIYRSAQDGFDFEAGDVWYVFRRGIKLTVGCMSEPKWRSIGTTDESDYDFQQSVNGAEQPTRPNYVGFAGRRIKRDPSIAKQAIINSGYVCEYTNQPTPFISNVTGQPYVEAHHLVPLGLQTDFKFSLDVADNIVALNPLWHSAIHHAEPRMVRTILSNLSEKRRHFLTHHGITAPFLIELYGCETIE